MADDDGSGGGGEGGPGAVPMATTLFRCPVCRCSAFAGRRSHLHSAGHQRRLRAALARLGEKVEAARRTLRRAAVVPFDPSEHRRPFWCVCCGREVERWHLSAGGRAVLHGGLLQHLASAEHKKAVSAFWWENKADPKLKPKFLISWEDYERFKASLSDALDTYEAKEDEVIQEMAAHIREVEQRRQEMVQAILEPQTETELCDGSAATNAFAESLSDSAFATEEEEQPGPSSSSSIGFLREPLRGPHGTLPGPDWLESGQSLTFIGRQAGEGNIHTGAKPPWLMDEEVNQGQIGPSYEEFLKEKEKEKLKKLPPQRVGANFDHSSQTGDGWLPSFGRVWNHGRRWQSRFQFKAEGGDKLSRTKKKRPKMN